MEAPAERKERLGPRYRALPRGRVRESHLFIKLTILSGLRLHPQEIHGLWKIGHYRRGRWPFAPRQIDLSNI
jgi:hypothetical protein